MNSYYFFCYGHPNIQSNHRNTLEITKDESVSLAGDCIIGVKADFHLTKLKEWMKNKTKARMMIEVNNLKEEIIFDLNQDFMSDNEIVLRIGEFKSNRTLGTRSDKSSAMLSPEIRKQFSKKDQKIKIELANLF